MVVAILAGLMALAAPFVFSMILHQRGAHAELTALQARAGAEAAQAHALSQLSKNTLKFDLAAGQPEVTTLADLRVLMDFPAASKELDRFQVNVQNPNGLMWSAKVEDEQAKVNLITCPPALLGNLLGSALLTQGAGNGATQLMVDDASQFARGGGWVSLVGERTPLAYSAVQGNVIVLKNGTSMPHAEGELVFDGRAQRICDFKIKRRDTHFVPFRSVYEIKTALDSSGALLPDEFARIERHLTSQSGLDGPMWGQGVSTNAGAGPVGGFTLEHGDGFTPGALVRITENGVPTNYARVRKTTIQNDGRATIELDVPVVLPQKAVAANVFYIQPEIRHPININTVSPEVLEAVFTGVCLANSKEAVTRRSAQELATMMLSGGITYTDQISLKRAFDQGHSKGILTIAQRDALYINATEPGSPKLKTSTVTFCFFSFGSYTIEGSGIVNSENGVQLARNTTRQLLTMPTPWPGRFKVQYQDGFQSLLEQGLGARVVTYPIPMGKNRDKKGAAIKLPSYSSGNIRLDVGKSAPHGQPGEFIEHCDDEKDPGYRQDGYDMSKRGPFTLPPVPQRGNNRNALTNQPTAVEMWYRPIGGGQTVFYDEGLEEDRNRVTFSYEPGGRPKPGLYVRIYDAGMECQEVETKDWNHLKRPPVECIYPVTLDHGDWFHVAASWKSSRMNGQEIRLDAQPEPKSDKLIFLPGARLASDLALDDDQSFEVETDDGQMDDLFPKRGGAVQIGEEIIEYRTRSGNTFNQIRRGARLSATAKHNSGEFVQPYGYSNELAQDLPVGGAYLSERLEKASAMSRCRVEVPPNKKPPYFLESEVAKLNVNDCSDFPPSGFLSIEGELIYYAKKTATAFTGLIRAQRSGGSATPARNIHNGAGVRLASIEITDSALYNPRGIVQIDDDSDDKIVEWFEYADKQVVNGKHYLTAVMHGGGPGYRIGANDMYVNGPNHGASGSIRNHFGIPTAVHNRESSHDKKAKVIQVIRMQGPHGGDQRSPYGDEGVSEVTVLTRGSTQGDLRYIKQAFNHQWAHWHHTGPNNTCPAVFDSWSLEYYVGLNDFMTRQYPARESRMLKWPSGELPDAVGAKRIIGADRNGEGQMKGHIDEIKVNSFQSQAARIAMTKEGDGISANDNEILLEEHDSWPRDGGGNTTTLNWPTTGLIRIEDELIFYKSMSTERFDYYADVFQRLKLEPVEQNKADRRWINPCSMAHELHPNTKLKSGVRLRGVIRGALNTDPADHPVGAQVMLLDGMSVSLLEKDITGKTDTFSVTDARGFADEGYVWVNNEVLSYTKRSGNSFSGCRYFRGSFGTSEGEHATESIVRSLPFRHWDREGEIYDGEGLAYLQAGYSASDAIWDGVELQITGTEQLPTAPTHVKPRVLVRFDGNPTWASLPTNQDGGLYEFKNKDGKMFLRNARNGPIRADQAEMRVFWMFTRGAFVPGQDWKRTFSIEKMRMTYRTQLIMRRLDEVEKR